MRIPSVAALAAVLAGLALPAIAQADDLVATPSRATPVSAYAGRVAWSAYDPAQNAYVLMTSAGGVTSAVPVAPRTVPFDVDLGPDQNGDTVAAYSRCRREPGMRPPAAGNAIVQLPTWETGRGCDIYRFTFATGRETPIAVANSPTASEFLPTVWKARVAFARVYERKRGVAGRPRLPLLARRGRRRALRARSGGLALHTALLLRQAAPLQAPARARADARSTSPAGGWRSAGTRESTSAQPVPPTTPPSALAHEAPHRPGHLGRHPGRGDHPTRGRFGSDLLGRTLFGDTTANSVRRYRITTGERQQAPLPTPGTPDAFIRSVVALAVDGSAVYYLLSGQTIPGEPCTPAQPCIATPGCSDLEPCRLMVARAPQFVPFKP